MPISGAGCKYYSWTVHDSYQSMESSAATISNVSDFLIVDPRKIECYLN